MNEAGISPRASIFVRLPFYYGWVNVVAAAIAMVTTLAGSDQGLGLITESLLKDLQIGRLEWSTIILCAALIGALFVFPTGKLTDLFGARVVLTAILVPLGASVIAMSGAQSSAQLWLTVIPAAAFGQSALSVASMALVGKWFGRRISLAMGVYAILVVIGFIAAFLIFESAIAANGWRATWRTFGWIILAGFAPLSWLFVRATPEALGLSGEFDTKAETGPPGMTWTEAMRTQAFWLFGLSSAFFGMLIGGIMLFYESILHERGFKTEARVTVLSVQTAAGLLASFLGGWAGQHWPLRRLLGIAMAGLALALALLATLASQSLLMVYASAMGVAGGLITVIFFAIWGQAFGRAHIGKIHGIAQGLCIVTGAFGPRILAQIHAASSSYALAFEASAVVSGVFCVWAWFVPVPKAGVFER